LAGAGNPLPRQGNFKDRKGTPVKDSIPNTFRHSIGEITDLAESTFGSHPQWPYFRRFLLRKLNNLKRNVERNLGIEGEQENGDTERTTED
jgi:hypothetical protein